MTTIDWPSVSPFGAAGTFTRMVAGDLSGDGIPDAVGLSGNKVVYFQDIGIHTALNFVPWTVNDIDYVPGPTPDATGSLAVVTSAGLEILSLRYPVSGPPAFTSNGVIADGWAGARFVRSAELNGTAAADFVGVEADGKTLIRRRDNPSTGLPEQATLTLTRTVSDLQILKRWTTSNPLAIAVLTPGGVTLYDQNWTALQFFPASVPGGVIAVVHETGSPDQVAWAMETSTGPQQLVLLSAAYGVRTGPTMPIDVRVVAITAGDLDGDGDDDVVLSHRHDYAPRCWKNDGFVNPVDPNATPSTMMTDGSEDSGADNHALPLVADLDLDGFADVVVAVQTTETYSVYLRQQSVAPAVLTSAQFFQPMSKFATVSTQATSRLMELKLKWDTFPSGATKMLVIVWEQDYTPYPQPPNPTSINNVLFSLPAPPNDNINNVVVTAPVWVDMPDPTTACFSSVYWFEVRAVKDSLAPASPTFFAALVSYADRADDIAAGGIKLEMDDPTPACGGTAPEHPGFVDLGNIRAPCVAPKRVLPAFGNGTNPQFFPETPFPSTLIPDIN